jgi:predicted dehydrogenase
MCDHTYCYTPAVQRIRELVHSGVLGELQSPTQSGST